MPNASQKGTSSPSREAASLPLASGAWAVSSLVAGTLGTRHLMESRKVTRLTPLETSCGSTSRRVDGVPSLVIPRCL